MENVIKIETKKNEKKNKIKKNEEKGHVLL